MELKNEPKVLGLDISTKTIGWALFGSQSQKLLELTHFSPRVTPRPDDKIEEHLKKATAFEEKLKGVKDLGIVKVILGVVPQFISTYNSRKFAHESLYTYNDKGKKVLFGGQPKGCDKKHLVWEQVKILEPHIVWPFGRTGKLKKECYDMSDAYTCVRGLMKQESIW